MPIITLLEVVYLVITTIVIGFIFTGYIPNVRKKSYSQDEILEYHKKRFLDWDEIKFAMLVASPGIILHELAHKFTGILFGIDAHFEIFWLGLGLGFLLKLISSPFLILAPGYVVLSGNASTIQGIIVSFAGPLMNLVLWLGCWYILKTNKRLKSNTFVTLSLMKHINMILFIFNMLPIPPFDGSKVFFGLYELVS